MVNIFEVEDVNFASSPTSASKVLDRASLLSKKLEDGNIIFFPKISFDFSDEDKQFLKKCSKHLKAKFTEISHKSYFCKKQKISCNRRDQFLRKSEKISEAATLFLSKLLTCYSSSWKVGGVEFSVHHNLKENNLLHFDFADNISYRDYRVLDFYINYTDTCFDWQTGPVLQDALDGLDEPPYLHYPKNDKCCFSEKIKKNFVKYFGKPVSVRTSFDFYLLGIFNFLNQCRDFQKVMDRKFWRFPPNSCWLMFSDTISHIPIFNENILTLSLYIPIKALNNPENSPFRILEKIEKTKAMKAKII